MRKTRKHQNRLYLNFWRAVYLLVDNLCMIFTSSSFKYCVYMSQNIEYNSSIILYNGLIRRLNLIFMVKYIIFRNNNFYMFTTIKCCNSSMPSLISCGKAENLLLRIHFVTLLQLNLRGS